MQSQNNFNLYSISVVYHWKKASSKSRFRILSLCLILLSMNSVGNNLGTFSIFPVALHDSELRTVYKQKWIQISYFLLYAARFA